MTKLYKYLGPEILPIATQREGYFGLKCALPEQYNDPFELFLCVDTTIDTQLLAFYKESLGELPQFPATCFSKSPVVVPMWAHYGHSSRGFVVEFDEEKLVEHSQDASIGDVAYADAANRDIEELLARAFVTCKPRHTFFLHKGIMHSAYFSKQSSWSYEQERRAIFPPSEVEHIDGNMIYFLPINCVSSIIAGAKTEDKHVDFAQSLAESIGCEFYRSYVGKSYPEKYMKDSQGSVYVFDGRRIAKTKSFCTKCYEPVSAKTGKPKLCSWCAITKAHARSAAENNVYRLLDHAGILGDHIRGMEEIWRKKP